ncbi:hypothetical protein HanIR_Chr07g0304861 [Helianthus annuus]|nr:hypothetical protein HanIR_Chr07g0304861 [Helianthus annuus]
MASYVNHKDLLKYDQITNENRNLLKNITSFFSFLSSCLPCHVIINAHTSYSHHGRRNQGLLPP